MVFRHVDGFVFDDKRGDVKGVTYVRVGFCFWVCMFVMFNGIRIVLSRAAMKVLITNSWIVLLEYIFYTRQPLRRRKFV